MDLTLKTVQKNEEDSPRPLQSSKNGDKKQIEGYAIRFNERSKKLGNFYEVIDAHALDSVDLSDVKALIDHDFSKVLGRTKSDTLHLKIDSVGLYFSIEVPNTSYANDLYESVSRGDISECSFGFSIDESDRSAQQISRLSDNNYLRTVKKIKTLSEISIVANPAYNSTSASIKRDFESMQNAFELEKISLELELLSM